MFYFKIRLVPLEFLAKLELTQISSLRIFFETLRVHKLSNFKLKAPTQRSSVSEAVITAHDDIGLTPIDPEIADTIDWNRHACRRTCRNDASPLDCYYTFKLESYVTMSKACYDCPFNMTDCFRPHCIPADGISRSVLVVNRQLPGPPIEVRYLNLLTSRAIVPARIYLCNCRGIFYSSAPY